MAATAVVALTIWSWLSGRDKGPEVSENTGGRPAATGKLSVVVAEFANNTGDPQLDWLRKGLQDMVLVNRSRLSVQPVTPEEWKIIMKMGRR